MISRSAVITTVTAGLKCAPEISAIVWIRPKSTNACTRPITEKSMKGAGFCGLGAATYSETTAVTRKTSNSVPMNSAI